MLYYSSYSYLYVVLTEFDCKENFPLDVTFAIISDSRY